MCKIDLTPLGAKCNLLADNINWSMLMSYSSQDLGQVYKRMKGSLVLTSVIDIT